MTFGGVIKKVSAFVAAVIVFFFAAGWYLSVKGFVMDENRNIVFVPPVSASETNNGYISTDIDPDLVLPARHVLGNKDAPITIYEYSSLGCSHCSFTHNGLYGLQKSYHI